MKYTIRTALLSFFIGWFSANCFYGFSQMNAVRAAQAETIVQQPPQQALNVVCTFDFPALPLETLQASND